MLVLNCFQKAADWHKNYKVPSKQSSSAVKLKTLPKKHFVSVLPKYYWLIDRPAGVEGGEEGHDAAVDEGVGRWVGAAAGEIGQLEGVGVDGGIPELGEVGEAADVVEMAVGEDDGRGAGVMAEAEGGGRADAAGGGEE